MTSFQCIVIGSGNAGCCAAFSAAEAGCDKVLVIDVCPPEWIGGNGFFTAGKDILGFIDRLIMLTGS
ncbi:hypothetical protein C8R45DRAFT_969398 [Mycena sanguinolenta]|nr:hypothetical protein C8R45DRAFT_969398 [Mycena sanguinolenta]